MRRERQVVKYGLEESLLGMATRFFLPPILMEYHKRYPRILVREADFGLNKR